MQGLLATIIRETKNPVCCDVFFDGAFKKLTLAEDLSVCIYICLSHVYSFFSLVFFFKTLGLRESVAVSSVFFQQLYLMLNHFRAACMAT